MDQTETLTLPGTAEPGTLRAAILETAARLFIDQGYHGVGMRDISRESGASKALLYYHFHNKSDLFFAVLVDHLNAAAGLVEQCRAANPTARAQIEAFLRAVLRWPPEKRAIIQLAKQEAKHLDPDTRQRFLVEYHNHFHGQIESILREGMESGELIPLDPALAARMLLGMALPILSSESGAAQTNLETGLNTLMQIFFEGLAQHS